MRLENARMDRIAEVAAAQINETSSENSVYNRLVILFSIWPRTCRAKQRPRPNKFPPSSTGMKGAILTVE